MLNHNVVALMLVKSFTPQVLLASLGAITCCPYARGQQGTLKNLRENTMLIQDVRPKTWLQAQSEEISSMVGNMRSIPSKKIVVRTRPLSDKCYQCGKQADYAAEFAVCGSCQSKADNEE